MSTQGEREKNREAEIDQEAKKPIYKEIYVYPDILWYDKKKKRKKKTREKKYYVEKNTL